MTHSAEAARPSGSPDRSASEGMIEFRNVQKVIDGATVLDVDSLVVRPGEVAAVVDPEGAGLAVLVALLTGRSAPTAGTVAVSGAPVSRGPTSRQTGVLFAEDALYRRLSARGNLLFYCDLLNLPASRADEVLVQVGLADHAAVPAGQLPGGLARRLAFGRALLGRPSTLVLAEPFSGCEPASVALISRVIRELAAEGAAVLILARAPAGLSEVCQSIYALDRGRVARASDREPQPQPPFKIPARQDDRVVLFNPGDVLYASADGDRTCLHTADGRFPTTLTLTELEARLARRGFFRAHRGYLVNLQRVRAVVPYTRDSFTLTLDDPAGTEIPLSKSSARELRDLLGY